MVSPLLQAGTTPAPQTTTATYLPDACDFATDATLGLIAPPFPPGTQVDVGVHERDNLPGRVVPPTFPRLDSRRRYAYSRPWGSAVVRASDLVMSAI